VKGISNSRRVTSSFRTSTKPSSMSDATCLMVLATLRSPPPLRICWPDPFLLCASFCLAFSAFFAFDAFANLVLAKVVALVGFDLLTKYVEIQNLIMKLLRKSSSWDTTQVLSVSVMRLCKCHKPSASRLSSSARLKAVASVVDKCCSQQETSLFVLH
jgi:hypothetical protein